MDQRVHIVFPQHFPDISFFFVTSDASSEYDTIRQTTWHNSSSPDVVFCRNRLPKTPEKSQHETVEVVFGRLGMRGRAGSCWCGCGRVAASVRVRPCLYGCVGDRVCRCVGVWVAGCFFFFCSCSFAFSRINHVCGTAALNTPLKVVEARVP